MDVLRARIFDAFAETPYPGDENISVPTYDDEGTLAYFKGRTWSGHTATTLRHHSSALTFFTADAFRYFLPAYMLAELDAPDEADVIAGHIAFDLTQTSLAEERLGKFTEQELVAIKAFFDECERRCEDSPSAQKLFADASNTVRRRLGEK
ncbi:MAG: hypothetical protein JSS02_09870 [Planctomycetes bacterium]|nr:hypothetical protein [Planctomycetota bacterium]